MPMCDQGLTRRARRLTAAEEGWRHGLGSGLEEDPNFQAAKVGPGESAAPRVLASPQLYVEYPHDGSE